MKRVWSKLKPFLLKQLTKSRSHHLRRLYWDMRAQDIHETWGSGTSDHEVLRWVMAIVTPQRLLDVGCGSGRCFPLYHELGVPQVVGQDVSSSALALCKERFPGSPYTLIHSDIAGLTFPENHFDLVVSTRVLAAVLPEDIPVVMDKLARLCRFMYLNEMTDSDDAGPSLYWFKHDYPALLEANGFQAVETGNIGQQTWTLYQKA